MLTPSKETYLALGGGTRPMPVYREMLADLETPLGAYWKLANDETYSFLLESVTGGEQLARYSLLGVRPISLLRTKGDRVTWDRGGKIERSVLKKGDGSPSVL